MSTPGKLEVLSVDRIDGTEIIVEFSDSTLAIYTTEELTALRPNRQKTNLPPDSPNDGQNGSQNG